MARGGDKGGKAAGGGRARKTREKGGERTFVTSMEEMSMRERIEEEKNKARKTRRADGEEGDDDDDDDDDDEDDDEEDDEEQDANTGPAFERVQTNSLFGFSQSALGPSVEAGNKKPSGVKAIVKTQNPNRMASQTKMVKAKNVGSAMAAEGAAKPELTRREREALEKEAAAARYMKKHLAGETDEAKKDLARLAEVKRRREEAEKRKAEEEAAAAEREKLRKKTEEKKDDDEILDARAIKNLKPNVLKDKLKERGLSIQGQKKDLIQRLIDYEDERAL